MDASPSRCCCLQTIAGRIEALVSHGVCVVVHGDSLCQPKHTERRKIGREGFLDPAMPWISTWRQAISIRTSNSKILLRRMLVSLKTGCANVRVGQIVVMMAAELAGNMQNASNNQNRGKNDQTNEQPGY
jgi:hypothetical protein